MIILEQFYTDQTSQTTLTYYDYYIIIINIKNKQKKRKNWKKRIKRDHSNPSTAAQGRNTPLFFVSSASPL